MKDDRLVCIFKGEPFEAEVIKGRLESEGIRSMITKNSMSSIISEYSVVTAQVSLLVNSEDEELAKKIVEDKNEDA